MNAKTSTAVATAPAAPARTSLVVKLADRFGVDPGKMLQTLKATAFKQQDGKAPVSDEQMMALLVVADQYGLNPFTKEIYAFADKGGIVPVVGVDGWARIVNEQPAFDGVEFSMADDGSACTCAIYRKDRGRPMVVTEYLKECRRDTGPWKSHPRRMLRHKAFMQAGRLAFGFAGIFDLDEGERIVASRGSRAASARGTETSLAAITSRGIAKPESDNIVEMAGPIVDDPGEPIAAASKPIDADMPARVADPEKLSAWTSRIENAASEDDAAALLDQSRIDLTDEQQGELALVWRAKWRAE